jgi:hypothetical protein
MTELSFSIKPGDPSTQSPQQLGTPSSAVTYSTGPRVTIATHRQFTSPNAGTPDQHSSDPNLVYYQQKQHQQKLGPRILQPVLRRPAFQKPQPQRQQQPHVNEEEASLLNVVDEEEQRNQKFFQKQGGSQVIR